MSTRTRSMALDGHSLQADSLTTSTTIAKVGVVIVGLLNDYGPSTDDALVERYSARAKQYSGIPMVTPQRIRTARADLYRRGLLRKANEPGLSQYGNPATRWALA